ncbi:hypothetical protein OQA88_7485 [Cercophora sp. LCS_1]
MLNWHQSSCASFAPDIRAVDGTAWCARCESLAPPDPTTHGSLDRLSARPEPDPSIRLHWPSSVNYLPSLNEQQADDPSESDQDEETQQQPDNQVGDDRGAHVYPPLVGDDGVRLLLVARGKTGDPVHATLVARRLWDRPQFKAVSYTWATEIGDTVRSSQIFLGSHWFALPVTVNCHEALECFRKEDEDVLLWIDAICIDQSNDSERNHQVGMMDSIYAVAQEVLVYIGRCDERSSIALDIFSHQRFTISQRERQNLHEFFQRQYFSRTWVIQEIANASSAIVHCGGRKINWSLFTESRFRAMDMLDNIPPWIVKVYMARRKFSTAHLLDLLVYSRDCKASDPRDKVFALLGLIQDAALHGLSADYHLSVREVYTGIAAFFMQNNHDFRGIQYCRGALFPSPSLENRYRIPSWVPDWSNIPSNTEVDRITQMASKIDDLQILEPETWRDESIVAGLPRPEIRQDTGALICHVAIIHLPKDLFKDKNRTYRTKYTPPLQQDDVRTPNTTVTIRCRELTNEDSKTALAIFPLQQQCYLIRPSRNPLTGSPSRFVVELGGPNPQVEIEQGTWEIDGRCDVLISKDLAASVDVNDPGLQNGLNGLAQFIFRRFPLEPKEWERMIRVENLIVSKLRLFGPIDETPVSKLFAYSNVELQEGFAFFLRGESTESENPDHRIAISRRLKIWSRPGGFDSTAKIDKQLIRQSCMMIDVHGLDRSSLGGWAPMAEALLKKITPRPVRSILSALSGFVSRHLLPVLPSEPRHETVVLSSMIQGWKQEALEITDCDDYNWALGHRGLREVRAKVRQAVTVKDVFGIFKEWNHILMRHHRQRLIYQEDKWDWEMIYEYTDWDREKLRGDRLWDFEDEWRKRLEWRGFLVQFLHSHRGLKRVEIV